MIPTAQDAQLEADWAAIAPAFDLVDANDYWLLYRTRPRRRPALDPPDRPAFGRPTRGQALGARNLAERTQRGPRMRRPGRAPVNSSWSTVCTPATNVAT